MLFVLRFLCSTTCNDGIAKIFPGTMRFSLGSRWDELKRRDTKKIYSDSRRAANIVGLDIPAETPEAPDLILENDNSLEPEEAVRLILDRVSHVERQRSSPNRSVVQFGTKAETLERLAPQLRSAAILPQVRFSVAEWRDDQKRVLMRIIAAPWGSESINRP